MLGGIAPGSSLGPLIFLVYVNQIPSQVSNDGLLQFVDDTCLFCSADSPTDVTAMLQDNMNALYQWTEMSKMKLNLNTPSPPNLQRPPIYCF